MEWILIAVLGLAFLVTLVAALWLPRKKTDEDSTRNQIEGLTRLMDRSRVEMGEQLERRFNEVDRRMNDQSAQLNLQVNQRLEQVTVELGRRLKETHELSQKQQIELNTRLDSSNQTVRQVQERLVALAEASNRIFEVGKDISGLTEILKSPKPRGQLGEFLLGDLLGQILPKDRFRIQHKFRSGEIVDALICLAGGDVPVDSKFPLDNFRRILEAEEAQRPSLKKAFIRDVKKHIDAISNKYINPEEGTLDFALMYIPAENVYYEIILNEGAIKEGLHHYALERKVIPVSPSSFYAYLAAIVYGLRGLKIEENAKVVIQCLGQLEGEFDKLLNEVNTMGGHIRRANSKYEEVASHASRFKSRLGDAGRLGESTDPPPLGGQGVLLDDKL